MGSKKHRKHKSARSRDIVQDTHNVAETDTLQELGLETNGEQINTLLESPPMTELISNTSIVATPIDVLPHDTVNTPPIVISLEEARKCVEMLCMSLLAAGISLTTILGPYRTKLLDFMEFASLLDTADLELDPTELDAIMIVCAASDSQSFINIQILYDINASATFRIEILELQLRNAIYEMGSSKTRGKVDVQRAITKCLSHLSTPETMITAKHFAVILEEKIGIPTISLLIRVVFARITHQPFDRSPSSISSVTKNEFISCLEAFCTDKPLSIDTLEGQLRVLATTHSDLRTSFQALDMDGSGTISTDEFVNFLQREAHMTFPRDVLLDFIKRFDIDGDGTLNYEEFVDFVYPKQFGIYVLTPFGMFYHSATTRYERMEDVVAKIKTRMFWMQHNDLFSTGAAQGKGKLKVTDRIVLTHHFGSILLSYAPSDPISKVLKNGEMVVLFLIDTPFERSVENSLPSFEYKLRPSQRPHLASLMCFSLAMDKENKQEKKEGSKQSLTSTKIMNQGKNKI